MENIHESLCTLKKMHQNVDELNKKVDEYTRQINDTIVEYMKSVEPQIIDFIELKEIINSIISSVSNLYDPNIFEHIIADYVHFELEFEQLLLFVFRYICCITERRCLCGYIDDYQGDNIFLRQYPNLLISGKGCCSVWCGTDYQGDSVIYFSFSSDKTNDLYDSWDRVSSKLFSMCDTVSFGNQIICVEGSVLVRGTIEIYYTKLVDE